MTEQAAAVQCINCVSFSLRDAGDLGRQGFGVCRLRSINKSIRESAIYPRQCEKFAPAAPGTVEKRKAVLA